MDLEDTVTKLIYLMLEKFPLTSKHNFMTYLLFSVVKYQLKHSDWNSNFAIV